FWNRRRGLNGSKTCPRDWDRWLGHGAAGGNAARAWFSRNRIGFRNLPTGVHSPGELGDFLLSHLRCGASRTRSRPCGDWKRYRARKSGVGRSFGPADSVPFAAGKEPNFLVGGVAENFGKSYGLGGGEELILEGDEYETAFWDRGPKFFHYHPDDLIVTSLEYDHADIYPDFETYQLAFRRLVNLVPRRGKVVLWGDTEESGPALGRAAEKAFCPVEKYGFGTGNDWVATDFAVEGERMGFRIDHRGKLFGEFSLTATGKHNALNAMAAMAVAHGRGISSQQIAEALGTFRSVKRRMDVKGEMRGVLLVDDFAHHPTAVKATIEAARTRWPGRRLWAILEPRSNSMRRKVFQEALPKALALGDRVILGGVYRAQQLGDDYRMHPEAVAADVRKLGKEAQVFSSSDAIAEYLARSAKPGDLLLIMSNGSFDGLCEKLLQELGSPGQIPGEAKAR